MNGVGGTDEVEAQVYVCPEESAAEILDEAQPWVYAHFRRVHLDQTVKTVLEPCRQRFVAEKAAEKAAAQAARLEGLAIS